MADSNDPTRVGWWDPATFADENAEGVEGSRYPEFQGDDPTASTYNDGATERGGQGGEIIDLNQNNAGDNATASAGDDAVYGNQRNNRLDGEEGQDFVEGRLGDDLISGGTGDDALFGGNAERNTADGNDWINGDAGCDLIDGENGDDNLFGGRDADLVFGGAGNDVIFGNAADAIDAPDDGGDILMGEGGNDSISGDAGDDLIFGGAQDDHLFGQTGDDSVDGGTGDDRIAGGRGADLLLGSRGDDEIFGDDRDDGPASGDGTPKGGLLDDDADGDCILGGRGNDTINGQGGADVLRGGADNDLIMGDYGEDTIDGGRGNDDLNGGADADSIRGGSGNDVIEGGAQADVLYGDLATGADINWFCLRAPSEVRQHVPLPQGYTIERMVLETEFDEGPAGDDLLRGGTGADTIFGEGGNDFLFGEGGFDHLLGGTGDDFLNGGGGNDTLEGEAGQDSLSGGIGDDLLLGGTEDDHLYGGNGCDTLVGEDGNDFLGGNNGADLLLGGIGEDSLKGGSGNDVLFGGAGSDQLWGGFNADFLSGEEAADTVRGGSGNDALLGGQSGDLLRGNNGADSLFGQQGADRIHGDNGADWLVGAEGNDWMYGGGANDVLIGGEGADRQWGGKGKDVFVFDLLWDGTSFTSQDGNDRIRDFDMSQDNDGIVFRVTNCGPAIGTNAGQVFAALNAAASVNDNGTNTTISVGGMSVRIDGLTGAQARFSSLGQDASPIGGVGINAASTGAIGSYEAVGVSVQDLMFDARLEENADPFSIDLRGLPGFDALSVFDVVDAPVQGSVEIDGQTLTFTTGTDFDGLAQGEFQKVSFSVFGFGAKAQGVTDFEDGASGLRTLWFEIEGVNDAPTLAAGIAAATEDGPTVDVDLAALGDDVDSDDDGASLTYTVSGDPSEGSADIDGTTLTFAPGADFQDLALDEEREVTVEVTATDRHGATAVNDVVVTVTGTNDDPTLAAGIAAATEDGPTVDVDLAALGDDVDSDDDGASLTYTVSGDPSEGTADIDGTTLTFDPGADFQDLALDEEREVTVEVTATDRHGATAVNDVVVTVTGTNDDPTLAAGVAAATEDGPTVDVDLAALGDDVDSDDDGASLTYTVSGDPAEGSADIDGTTLTFDPGMDFQDLALDEEREVTVEVTATDRHGATAVNDVVVTVTGTNDDPTLAAGVAAATEDGPTVDVDLAALGDDVDSDDDGASLIYTVSGDPAEGSADIDGTTLTFDPGADFQDLALDEEREVTVEVTATDRHGATAVNDVVVTVAGTNDDPTLAAGIAAATEDGPTVDVDLAALGDDVDSDDDGASLTYTVSGDPSEGSADIDGTTLTFDPGADFQDLALDEEREVTVEVTATDRHGATAVNDVVVTVTGTNDDPTLAAGVAAAVEDGPSVDVDLSVLGDDVDSDDDGASLTYTVSGDPSEGSADIDGTTLTFDPGMDFQDLALGEEREVTVEVTATDRHGATAVNDVVVTVTGTNDDPTLAAGVAAATEDGPTVDVDLAALGDDVDSDDDGASLIYTVSGDPAEGSADIDGTTLTFDPGADFQDLALDEEREVTVEVTATDRHGATAVNDVVVTVAGTNDDPTLAAGIAAATEDGPTVDVDLAALGDDVDSDDDGASLTYTVSGDPAEGSADIDGTTLTFDPGADFQDLALDEEREVTVEVTATDRHGATAVNDVVVTVTGTNDEPDATDSLAATNPETEITGQLGAEDPDTADTLSYTLLSGPGGGVADVTEGGAFSYTPDEGFSGEDTFEFEVSDGNGGTDTGTVTITVAAGLGNVRPIRDFDLDEIVSQTVANPDAFAEVAATADGGHVVVFSASNSGNPDTSGWGVYLQRYDDAGARVGDEELVNTTTSSTQLHPSVAVLSDGSWVVVWQGNGPGDSSGIHGQRYNADGTKLGAEFRVNATSLGSEQYATVSELANGDFAVSWEVWTGSSGNRNDVYTRVFSDAIDGTTNQPIAVTADILTNTTTAGDQYTRGQVSETVAGLTGGRFVSVWTDNNSTDGSGRGVFGRLFEADGTPVSVGGSANEFQINTVTSSTQEYVSVGALSSGGFVAVWHDYSGQGEDNSSSRIVGQRYDANGARVGGEFEINTFTPNNQLYPKVQGFSDGGFAVVWESYGVDGSNSYSISGQRYDAAGDKVGTEFVVESEEFFGNDRYPSLAVRSDDSLVVVWHDQTTDEIDQKIIESDDDIRPIRDFDLDEIVSQTVANPDAFAEVAATADGGHVVVFSASNSGNPDTSGWGVYLQRYDDTGARVGDEQLVNTTTSSTQIHPSVAVLSDGSLVVVWQGNGPGDSSGIHGQRYNADGTKLGAEFRVNATSLGSERYATVSELSNGDFAVSWEVYTGNTNRAEVYTRVFSDALDGTTNQPIAVTADILTNTTTAGDQLTWGFAAETVAGLTGGRFVSVWIDNNSTDGSGRGVFGRLFEADGTSVNVGGSTAEFQINTITSSTQEYVSVGALSSGGFVAVWHDYSGQGDDRSGARIVGQRYDADGARVGGEFEINTFTPNNQLYPKVQGFSDGGFAVVWESYGVDGSNSYSISGQRYDAAGDKVGTEFVVESEEFFGNDRYPSLAVRSDDSLVVAWHDQTTDEIDQKIIESDDDIRPIRDFDLDETVSQTVANPDNYAEVAATADGGHVVVFSGSGSGNPDTSGWGVYLQRYDDTGARVGDEELVNTTTSSTQLRPSVAVLSDGSWVVVWEGNGPGDASGIHGQRYNADGTKLGAEFRVNATSLGSERYATVSELSNGDFAVSWEVYTGNTNRAEVYTRVFSDAIDGTTNQPIAVTADILTNTTTAGDQYTWGFAAETVAGLTGGRFVSVWIDNNSTDGSGRGVFGRLFEADGTPVSVGGSANEFQINTVTSSTQEYVSVGALSTGGFVAVWRDNSGQGNDSSSYRIAGQRYDADGARVGGEFEVNTFTPNNQLDPKVHGFSDGGFAVVWVSYGVDGSNSYSISGQRYDAAGDKVGTEFLVESEEFFGNDLNPSLAVRDDDSLVVVWYDQTTDEIDQKIVDFGGGAAAKTLVGGTGPDSFLGSDLADTISGEGGDDRIEALGGDDVLSGGAGADVFVFNTGDGNDVVTDFEVGVDVFELLGLTIDTAVDTDANGDPDLDTLVTFDTGDTVTLLGVSGLSDPDDLL